MITFGKAYAIGNGAELKGDAGVYEDGREIGRIYFMPLSFNQGFTYNLIINNVDFGFFDSIESAKISATKKEKGKFYY